MTVSNERRDWIVLIARWQGDFSEDQRAALTDDELDEYYERQFRDFFASVTDPEELHIFAAAFPYYHHVAMRGLGFDILRPVVCHPACDLGTALLIYWRVKRWLIDPSRWPEGDQVPVEMKEFLTRSFALMEQVHQQTISFLAEVERRVVGQEYRTASQGFDPRNDDGEDLTAAAVAVSESEHQPPIQMYQVIGLPYENRDRNSGGSGHDEPSLPEAVAGREKGDQNSGDSGRKRPWWKFWLG